MTFGAAVLIIAFLRNDYLPIQFKTKEIGFHDENS